MKKRGQIIAFDMVASAFMLVLFLSILGYMWLENTQKIERAAAFSKSVSTLIPISELFMKHDVGFVNENSTYLQFVLSDNVINDTAFNVFLDVVRSNYTRVKTDLGLSDDYYLEVLNISSTKTLVREPNISASSFTKVSVINRYALWNGTRVRVIVGVIE
ncbi:hypothetical protein COT72_05655 [archaeon CG10_big_fil_rev_8_21_14_0_10_43_11]|nr:MAG: hypothetical protein COT72_05655 [archaeon CG10_big_fil_rev_8_21_14_0_10_43_11]